jgi:hypothetical protein
MWASFEVGKYRRMKCVGGGAYLFKMIASELLFEVTIMVYE